MFIVEMWVQFFVCVLLIKRKIHTQIRVSQFIFGFNEQLYALCKCIIRTNDYKTAYVQNHLMVLKCSGFNTSSAVNSVCCIMLIDNKKYLSPVHTKNDNYKDNNISVHTSER